MKGTIHWVSAQHAIDAEVRLYDRLFTSPDPENVPEGQDFTANLNPASLEVRRRRQRSNRASRAAIPGARFQFERIGYFCVDPDSTPALPVFNRTVGLRDTWARIEKREE